MRPRLVRLAIALTLTLALAGCGGAQTDVPEWLRPTVDELLSDPLVKSLPPGVDHPDREKVNKSCESGGAPFVARDFSFSGDPTTAVAFYRQAGEANGWHVVTDRELDPNASIEGADAVLVLERPAGAARLGFAVRAGKSRSGEPSVAVNGYVIADRPCGA